MITTLFRQLGFAALLLGTVLGAQAAPDLAQTLPIGPQVLVGQLENGLTYFIQKNSRPEKRLELRLAVKAGSILEDDDQLGLAHFTEHMAFNGSTHFKKHELVSYLQSIGLKFGADLNAYTGFNETVYILPHTDRPARCHRKGLSGAAGLGPGRELPCTGHRPGARHRAGGVAPGQGRSGPYGQGFVPQDI